jgi:hypothetical protein
VNPSRPPTRCRMPAAATTRSPSAALDGSAASRAASSCWRSPGTGSGSPGAGRIPCPVRARAISSANSGLPPKIRCSRSRTGRARSPPIRSLKRRVIASSRNGPMDTRWRLGAGPSDQARAGRLRNQGAGPPGSELAHPPGDEPRTPAPWPRAHPATGHHRSRRSPGRTRPARAAAGQQIRKLNVKKGSIKLNVGERVFALGGEGG